MRMVSSHRSSVVSSKAALCRTPAAQTSAVGGPIPTASSKSRSTSAGRPTSAGTAVAAPPAFRMLTATASTCAAARAAPTAWAPASAMASAVARPIPLPAPVITATRPLSQLGESPTRLCTGPGADLVVEAFVGRNGCLEIQVRFGVLPAIRPTDRAELSNALRSAGDIICWHEKAGLRVTDDLTKGAAVIGNHRRPSRLRLGGRHPEWLFPPGWTQDRQRASHEAPDLGARHSAMDRNAWFG